jgi:hypothetical protein
MFIYFAVKCEPFVYWCAFGKGILASYWQKAFERLLELLALASHWLENFSLFGAFSDQPAASYTDCTIVYS